MGIGLNGVGQRHDMIVATMMTRPHTGRFIFGGCSAIMAVVRAR